MLLEKYQASCCLVFVYSNQENSTWSTTKSKERMILIWFVDGLFVSPVMKSGVSGWDLSCKDLVALMDIKVHKMRQTLWTAHHVLFAFTMSELSGVFFTTCCMQLHKLGPGRILISDFSKRQEAVKVWRLFKEIYDPKTCDQNDLSSQNQGENTLSLRCGQSPQRGTRCTSNQGCRVLKMIICCIIEKVKIVWIHFFKEDNVPWPETQK